MSELPHSWTEASIVEVTTPFMSVDPTKTPDRAFRYVDIGSIDNKMQAITDPKSFLGRDAPSRARRLIRTGDTLFSTVRTYLKNIAMVPEELNGELTSTGIAVLRPNDAVDPGYLFRWACSDDFVGTLSSAQDGTMYPAVSDRDVAAASIPLPPLPEQRRIVTKIESLTGKSRRARDHLDHIPRLVEKYKQAVLTAAFRGSLIGRTTAETEQPHDRCWDLPTSWRWVRFSDVVEIASNLVQPREIPDLPHVAPDNVESATGRLLPCRTIREDAVISAKHRFFAGQVIYSKIRPYLRKAVLVDFDGACSADMYPLTASADLDPTYLLYWLISEPFAGFTVEHEGRTVLPKINQQGLNQTPFPLPPLADQMELVRCLRSAFTWIDRLATEATTARKLIDRLDQAVLAKAFRGELVPQDPADEPANVLLERIKAERGATLTEGKAGRRTQ
ncbi:hypothetical protein FJ952_11090 [Mesorhizobium sp. B2-4-10]|uniref:hypothetical protein n=1 Tax=Mesorhizobium sp. B2-4-10 TaxID=2589939 RepID=UPI0011265468|nr:hypothetical protein [Mesorhizobium sp. B2-4-10]TPL19438.1 hypothetical protein FJ952_11090 [Mesorhizobium sp. B2-4-10]